MRNIVAGSRQDEVGLVVGQLGDRILGRRKTWNGVAVKDLTRYGTNQYYGRYFRVSESGRDPETGAWGVRWSLDTDQIARPVGEPIYLFDGTTWDLPAEASTVFPKGTLIFFSVIAFVLTSISHMVWDGIDATGMALAGWVVMVVMTGWQWYYNVEPVRGTKVGAAITAASAARAAHNRRESRRMIAEFNKHSEILKYVNSLDPEEARRYGLTQEDS